MFVHVKGSLTEELKPRFKTAIEPAADIAISCLDLSSISVVYL